MFKVAFVGTPNAGKSTWINYMAGTDMKVANYMGVSVEACESTINYQGSLWTFVDLPGVYDLYETQGEEKYTRTYLENSQVDLLVNVIDVRDWARGLHVCAQLKALSTPMVVLLNFVDDAMKQSEVKKISDAIKTPVIFGEMNNRPLLFQSLKTASTAPLSAPFDVRSVYEQTRVRRRKSYGGDRILLHPIGGIPCLICILTISIGLTYMISKVCADTIIHLLEQGSALLLTLLSWQGLWQDIASSFCFVFVSVIGFLPFLSGIFCLVAVLEESGYMARIAYLLDTCMQRFHLSGRSVIPLLVGFGCNVPAIMATRTIHNTRQRKATALMIPFISCSAKLPIFMIFAGVFFGGMQWGVIALLYGVSLLCALWVGAFFAKQKNDDIFLLELPSLAIPQARVVYTKVKKDVVQFIKKISKIMIFSIFLLTFLIPYVRVDMLQSSLKPLGFSQSYEAVESIPFGLISKENLVVYYAHKKQSQDMRVYISTLWTKDAALLALCYLLYVAMSVPCVMTLATIRSEFGTRFLLLSLLVMLVVPYIMSLVVYQGVHLLRFLF